MVAVVVVVGTVVVVVVGVGRVPRSLRSVLETVSVRCTADCVRLRVITLPVEVTYAGAVPPAHCAGTGSIPARMVRTDATPSVVGDVPVHRNREMLEVPLLVETR